ncbi:MAG TPA: DUF222 domain-containing protein [Actinomycetes bacterium]
MELSTGAASAVVDRVATAAQELVAAVRAGAVAGAQAEELAGLLGEVRRVQARLEWVALAVVREVDVSGAHRGDGALTPPAWLRQRARLTPSEAGAAVRTARALGSGSLAATSAALAGGEIDPAHARLIARDAVDAPAGAVGLIEPLALAAARDADPSTVAAVMAGFRHALDPDAADAAAVRRYEQRGLSAATTLDGMVAGRFLLDPVVGSALLTALDAAGPLRTGETRTAPQRRADALGDIVRHFLGRADAPRTAGAHPHVIVTTGAGTGTGTGTGTRAPSGGSRLSWVGLVPDATAERVACDAQVTIVGVDTDGAARDLSRHRRFFTWTQRLAMIARDGDHCVWPWCQRPIRWTDGHHLIPVGQGGRTTVANGALPCEGHHLMLHEGGWTLHRLRDGRYRAHHGDGRVIGPEPHRRPRGLRPPPRRRE